MSELVARESRRACPDKNTKRISAMLLSFESGIARPAVVPLVEPEVVACVEEDEECTEEEAEVELDVVAELDEVLVWTLELDEGEKDVFGATAFVDEEAGLDWSSPPKFHVPQM